MVEMCRVAVERGIPEIGFSDHFDLHPLDECRGWFKPATWWPEIEACRRQFAGRLVIRAGLEIGEPHLFQPEVQALLSTLPFDYTIGSLHHINDHFMFDEDYFRRVPAEAVYQEYFSELEAMTRTGGFDVLGHLDIPTRTAFSIYGEYEPQRYEGAIRAVLQNCIDRGIAIDLNAVGLRLPIGRTFPGLEILRWYTEMGGERISLGSDAHRPEHVGAHLETTLQIARTAGLSHITQFELRQAKLIPIP